MPPVYKGQLPSPDDLVQDLFGPRRVRQALPPHRDRAGHRPRQFSRLVDRTCPHQPSCLSPGGTKCLLLTALGWKNSEEKS